MALGAAAARPAGPFGEVGQGLVAVASPEGGARLAAGLGSELVLVEEERADRPLRLSGSPTPSPGRTAGPQHARPVVEREPAGHRSWPSMGVSPGYPPPRGRRQFYADEASPQQGVHDRSRGGRTSLVRPSWWKVGSCQIVHVGSRVPWLLLVWVAPVLCRPFGGTEKRQGAQCSWRCVYGMTAGRRSGTRHGGLGRQPGCSERNGERQQTPKPVAEDVALCPALRRAALARAIFEGEHGDGRRRAQPRHHWRATASRVRDGHSSSSAR